MEKKKLKLKLKTPSKEKKTEPPTSTTQQAATQQPAPIAPMGGFSMPQSQAVEGGIKIILKNAKIEIGQVILKGKKEEKEEE
ncbi:MAG: hypothetical protein EF806_04190 [Candidatus Methanoliparum thermophilum]|uniref:Uncharacterized protein n=1 Tax=Methanoliparum thermophilum TaxID=2491083 RepID=A0A520KS17_METT2|nr:hypothetical protein [Candidatus Methanoliparum sp. LAM-1]RZN64547.1 MAG: hypothetical protein EF806_04190 [Candidatus Methanoliparum thermophilum]BDC35855.1 hypothetical protein MTLP_05370 [Candidatus Methanoliparum sp. LAM-1]